MLRRACLALLLAVVALPVAAQVPGAWKVRMDGSRTASAADADPKLKLMSKGDGLHILAAAGGVVWDPARTVKGLYTVRATFALAKPGQTPAQYGLVFAGRDFEGATPDYVYFTIAQDGTYQVRHRAGDTIHEIDGTPHFAIRKPGAGGASVNTLEVRVAPTAVSYVVNGAVVTATPTRAGMGSYTEATKTDGMVGIRIDDRLDVEVTGFQAGK